MSAALGTCIVDLDEDELVEQRCAAAVDPMEVAAVLETVGISHKVVNDRYGLPDVFALASNVWRDVPFRAVDVAPQPLWRNGNVSDLFRGALYAAPALMLLAVNRVAITGFEWWVLPLAITWGWALGQVAAHVGYGLRARSDVDGEARLVGLLLFVALFSTAGVAAVASVVAEGDATSIVAATGMTLYMVSSAVLLLNEEEYLGAILLVPGAVVTVAVFATGGRTPAAEVVVALVAASGAGTVVAACRHVAPATFGLPAMTAEDRLATRHHLLHGLISGCALSVVAILGIHVFPSTASPALVALPLLATLGVMEWQLRSFRAAVERLAGSCLDVRRFAPRAWGYFCRSVGWYVGATSLVTVTVAIAIGVRGGRPPWTVLASQIVLGTLFFADLVLVSLDRLDLVLRAWSIGITVAVTGALVVTILVGRGDLEPANAAWAAACLGVVVVLTSLLTASHDVVRATLSH